MNRFYTLTGYASGICIIVIAVAILIQISGRVIDTNLFGLVEISTYAMVAATFIALPYTLRTGGHIRVNLLLGLLKGRARWAVEIAGHLIAAVFVAIFFYYCLDLALDSYARGARSQGMISSPLWIPQSAMTLGLLLFEVALVHALARLIRNGEVPDDSPQDSL